MTAMALDLSGSILAFLEHTAQFISPAAVSTSSVLSVVVMLLLRQANDLPLGHGRHAC